MKNQKMKNQKMTLTRWLIHEIDKKGYRSGKVKGNKHPDIKQELLDEIGKANLLREAQELHDAGIINVDWSEFGNDITKIHFSVDAMDALCKREGIVNPKVRLHQLRVKVEEWQNQTNELFIKQYYQHILDKMKEGTIPNYADNEELAMCLNAIPKDGTQEWERGFSTRVLNNSKLFKEKYRTRFVTILKNYSPKVVEGMDEQEILAEHGILTYAQTLQWKGPLKYQIDGKWDVDTLAMRFGTIINAQTMDNSVLAELADIKRIIIIENKANYEAAQYDSQILYIYCHGFFSPKERKYLLTLNELADSNVEFFHWSDMDYGGIRIYNFVKKNIFPRLQPLHMDRKTFEEALRHGDGISLLENKRKKLEKMDAGDLNELKECILASGLEIEQEVLLKQSLLSIP